MTYPYLTYAGIGSCKTPPHIRDVMLNLGAHLCSAGWTLRSGGAEGADTSFENGVDVHLASVMANGIEQMRSKKEIYLPWRGFNNNPSQLHPANFPFSEQEKDLSSRYHPAWHKCSPSAKLLHTRNLRQMVGHPSVAGEQVQLSKFVVCWTEGGLGQGGTGQALRIAQSMDIPIIDLGRAVTPDQLEALVLEADRLQATFKEAA